MDEPTFTSRDPKCTIEVVEGKVRKALQFQFAENAKNVFATGKFRGGPDWDKAQGLSFWVKGDGSPTVGALQIVWGDDFKQRYDFAFPINGTEWTKVVVPWRDLVPVLPAPPIDPVKGNAPSKLGQIWFGKWWYWRDYPAQSYAIDQIQLDPAHPDAGFTPSGDAAPLAQLWQKLRSGQSMSMVTMGDSLTDFAHWANKPVNWPTLVEENLEKNYGCKLNLVNPAVGGTQLEQNIVLMPRWLHQTPAPQIVTICFGYNDWGAGVRGDQFLWAQKEAVKRLRRANPNVEILLMTTCPSLERWNTMSELAEATRKAARETKVGLADLERAFHEVPEQKRAELFCRDKVHLSPAGHRLVAQTVIAAIERQGR